MNFQQMSEQAIRDIADPMMDNLMQASTDVDHGRHVRDFTDRMKNIVTPEYLAHVCQQSQAEKGSWLHREPLAVLRRPDSAVVIWKQYCSKAEGEYVAEMVLVFRDNRYQIDHVMVF
ncbi:hypothetical protein [Celerinatantimonas sp. YJH-8]|uniref:hypothetical protein n=1 Tax=Celerinatantimonas sp. YJH-8 TaxID=3228714 RepID=UPI0038C1B52D